LPLLSDLGAVAVVAAIGAVGTVIDLRTRRVPNWLTAGVAAAGVGLAAAHLSRLSVPAALGGLGIGLLLMLPGYVIGATGAGDVKLMAALGTLLGPGRTGMAFLYSAMAGGLLALLIAMQRSRVRTTLQNTATLVRTGGANVSEIESATANNRFAYVPAIAVGALVAALGH